MNPLDELELALMSPEQVMAHARIMTKAWQKDGNPTFHWSTGLPMPLYQLVLDVRKYCPHPSLDKFGDCTVCWEPGVAG